MFCNLHTFLSRLLYTFELAFLREDNLKEWVKIKLDLRTGLLCSLEAVTLKTNVSLTTDSKAMLDSEDQRPTLKHCG